jgi:hypothetical protein
MRAGIKAFMISTGVKGLQDTDNYHYPSSRLLYGFPDIMGVHQRESVQTQYFAR